jgi:phosphoribosylformimino-5-aminoimidazole carboxamide ribonucleotide (ProFAR) isomerase
MGQDWKVASTSSLVNMIESYDAEKLKKAIVAEIKKNGMTDHQYQFFMDLKID